ncbi:Coenzyme F420-reducing hydrogenase alpha subunit-like [Rhodopseudomonas palustris BisB5]|uniref:Coenzyme F420-reducing hydrogenase alpha subunit-like n=1 Tax=Rhodopseudomonas palustris (strain BisB5) TaxID=316057 RepID=Q13BX9_RHOPS|nr:Coenzyme F420-reducing hydrogenase alpha subunit-like [Rhodopseudomonas palustris BisB5]
MNAIPRDDRIAISVVLSGGRVSRIEITGRRPIGMSRLAQGRSGEAVVALAPRLFALCAAAQGVAAVHALAAARGESVFADTAAAQASAVLAERLVELLRGTITTLAGDALPAWAPLLRDVIAAARRFDQAGLLEADAIDAIERGLDALGLPAGCVDDADACRDWLASAAPVAELHRPLLGEEAEFGACAVEPLTDSDDHAIGEQLLRHGASFALRPDIAGRVPETGSLARQALHPLIQSYGTGLAGRLLARLIEIRATPDRLRALRNGHSDVADIMQATRLGDGLGLAAVECARGRLHHLIALDSNGLIRQFDILAPTEWNFHPQGPLARSLTGQALRATDDDRSRVERLVAAFDPCVGFDVHLREAADA